MGEQGEAVERSSERSSGRRKVAVGIAVVALALVIGASVLGNDGDGGDDAAPEDRPAPSDGFRYDTELRVPVGERALVVNADDVPHSYTADDGVFDSDILEPGGEARLPSLPAGSYTYHCEIHPSLRGELVVGG